MKKNKIIIIMLIMMLIIIFPLTINATNVPEGAQPQWTVTIPAEGDGVTITTNGEVIYHSSESQINPDNYKSDGPSTADVKDMYKFGGRIAGVVQILGTIVSAGALIIIGIRYVIASADEKAEYRERILPYFIGAILLFGATNLVNIAYKLFN